MDIDLPPEDMCEVVMNDEDDGASEDALNFYLPPVPTFDLQADQFAYDPVVDVPTPTIIPPEMTEKETIMEEIAKDEIVVDKKEFLDKLFYKPFTAIVNEKQCLEDMSGSEEEKKYYNSVFTDLRLIEYCRLHCTICDKHIGCGEEALGRAQPHIMLSVLVCKACHTFYGDGNFPRDETDNSEIYCRWCGQGGDLSCCSFCPKVFCNKCVKRNYGQVYLKKVQRAEDWACFCCAAKPIWPLRAIWTALNLYLNTTCPTVDRAICCQKREPKKERKSISRESPRVKALQSPITPKTPMIKTKEFAKLLSQTFAKKKKTPRQNRPSFLAGNDICPLLQRNPVILPNPLALPNTSMVFNPLPKRGGFVRIAQRDPLAISPNRRLLPANKEQQQMPVVKIDHDTQTSLLVRIKVAGKCADQMLRINVSGSCIRMPQFPPPKKRTFVQNCLNEALKASKMSCQHLISMTNNTENMSEDDGHNAVLAYLDGWKNVVAALETDVKRNMNSENNATRSNVVVLDDDDDNDDDDDDDEEEANGLKWTWRQEASRLNLDEWSDVQIIEERPQKRTRNSTSNDNDKNNEKRRKRKRDEILNDPAYDSTTESLPSNSSPMASTSNGNVALPTDAKNDMETEVNQLD